MGLNWRQFELGVLRPTLEGEPEVAIKLVGETIWHESDRLQALGQYANPVDDMGQRAVEVFGPGLGIASIELATWDWMLSIPRQDKFGRAIAGRNYVELTWDLRLNVLACRFRYKLNKLPLPEDSVLQRSFYWLEIYNGSSVNARRIKYLQDALDIPWVKG